MKIIKEGNKELADTKRAQVIKFHCSMCECIWEANKNEYKNVGNHIDGDIYECCCPTCGERIYVSKY